MRVVGILIFLFKVFPRLIRETNIQDGIFKLRLFIFHGIIFFFIAGLILAQMNYCNIVGCDIFLSRNVTTVVQAGLFLSVSIILYLIYHQKYKDHEMEG